MAPAPVDLDTLLAVVDDPRSVADLADHFQPDRTPGTAPQHPGSRFESLSGGGDRPGTVDRVTAEDLVALTLRGAGVPGDVALELLEGRLGEDVAQLLRQVPTDVGIGDAAAVGLLSTHGHVQVARDLLEEPPGMTSAVSGTLLARKRPRLVPVEDGVVRCALGRPTDVWDLLLSLFADGRLERHLRAAQRRAAVPANVSALRVLDVVLWTGHRPAHLQNGCTGPGW